MSEGRWQPPARQVVCGVTEVRTSKIHSGGGAGEQLGNASNVSTMASSPPKGVREGTTKPIKGVKQLAKQWEVREREAYLRRLVPTHINGG